MGGCRRQLPFGFGHAHQGLFELLAFLVAQFVERWNSQRCGELLLVEFARRRGGRAAWDVLGGLGLIAGNFVFSTRGPKTHWAGLSVFVLVQPMLWDDNSVLESGSARREVSRRSGLAQPLAGALGRLYGRTVSDGTQNTMERTCHCAVSSHS